MRQPLFVNRGQGDRSALPYDWFAWFLFTKKTR